MVSLAGLDEDRTPKETYGNNGFYQNEPKMGGPLWPKNEGGDVRLYPLNNKYSL